MSVPLNPFQRHSRQCRYYGEPRNKICKCSCTFWADGKPLRQWASLRTNDYTEARRRADWIVEHGGIEGLWDALAHPGPEPEDERVTIETAREEWLNDPDFLELARETQGKHRTLLNQLLEFSRDRGLACVEQITPEFIAEFRKWWKVPRPHGNNGKMVSDGKLAAAKKTERLHQICRFFRRRRWIAEDPMEGLKAGSLPRVQTAPFDENEMGAILKAADERIAEAVPRNSKRRFRARALVLLLRYSGMRLGDCVSLKREDLKNGRVRRWTGKNDVFVEVELPKAVADELAAIPPKSEVYFFWTGVGRLKGACNRYAEELSHIFEHAKISNGHAHRFRDTFAVAILETEGKTLQDVADALGDTLAVVQRHYNPWSKPRQEKTAASIRESWKGDKILEKLERAGKSARVVSIRRR